MLIQQLIDTTLRWPKKAKAKPSSNTGCAVKEKVMCCFLSSFLTKNVVVSLLSIFLVFRWSLSSSQAKTLVRRGLTGLLFGYPWTEMEEFLTNCCRVGNLAWGCWSRKQYSQILTKAPTSREQTFDPRLKWALVPTFFAPGTRDTFSPSWCLQPGLKVSPNGYCARQRWQGPLVPVGATNRD